MLFAGKIADLPRRLSSEYLHKGQRARDPLVVEQRPAPCALAAQPPVVAATLPQLAVASEDQSWAAYSEHVRTRRRGNLFFQAKLTYPCHAQVCKKLKLAVQSWCRSEKGLRLLEV